MAEVCLFCVTFHTPSSHNRLSSIEGILGTANHRAWLTEDVLIYDNDVGILFRMVMNEEHVQFSLNVTQ